MKAAQTRMFAWMLLFGLVVSGHALNNTLVRTLSEGQVRERIINHKGYDLSQDTDGDGISDTLELQLGTDPTKADSDGDLVPDGIEVAQGLDPAKANPYPEFVYLVTKLPIPAGYSDAEGYDLSNTGLVSGAAYVHSTSHKDSAARWNIHTGTVEVAPSTVDSYGWSINDSGSIAGKYNGLALYWGAGKQARSVNRTSSDTNYSSDIDASGKIVGYLSSQFPGDTGAYAWVDGGNGASDFTHLAAPSGYRFPRAEAINDKRQIVGLAFSTATSQRVGVVWNNAAAAVIPISPRDSQPAFDETRDINRLGAILGYRNSRPGVWTPTEGRRFLSAVEDASISAWKLNAFGEVIGTQDGEPTLWRPDGTGDWEAIPINPQILDEEVSLSFSANSINDAGQITGSYYDASDDKLHPVVLTPILLPELAVDANRDGVIKLASEDASDTTSVGQSYRFWINDDFDGYGGFSPAGGGLIVDHSRNRVAGVGDLADYFPVFLNIKQLLNAMPPSSGITYTLKQADGALKAVFTTLTRETAFAYKDLPYSYSEAFTYQITPEGLPLSESFLNSIKNGDNGVLLMEGTRATTRPLVLVIEKGGVVVLEVSLPLSIGQDIVLLLHGMNSNTSTWDEFVDSASIYSWSSFAEIRDGDIWGSSLRNSAGVVCYRLQFGAYDLASPRIGLEGVKATDPGYDTVTRRCGDFETFTELGDEVKDAITLLLSRYENAHIVLVGHSRGGISARAFLQMTTSADRIIAGGVIFGLLTTSSPHSGSRLARIYGWLNTHRRDEPFTDEHDWEVVDFLRGVGFPWAPLPESLDVRRPVILDVADNSLAIEELNSPTALQNIPVSVRCAEIQYANARLGVLALSPFKYSVFDGIVGPQLSRDAAAFLLSEGNSDDVSFVGDGLVPRANQKFTQLTGFSGVALSARVVTDTEVVHIEAPKRSVDLLAQLKVVAPRFFP